MLPKINTQCTRDPHKGRYSQALFFSDRVSMAMAVITVSADFAKIVRIMIYTLQQCCRQYFKYF